MNKRIIKKMVKQSYKLKALKAIIDNLYNVKNVNRVNPELLKHYENMRDIAIVKLFVIKMENNINNSTYSRIIKL